MFVTIDKIGHQLRMALQNQLSALQSHHHERGGVRIGSRTVVCQHRGRQDVMLYRIPRFRINGMSILLAALIVEVTIVATGSHRPIGHIKNGLQLIPNVQRIIGWFRHSDLPWKTFFASLTAPVINRSSLKAELQKAKAEQESARIAFRQAILDAGKEVNDALASEQYARKAIELNRQQIEKLTRVVENSKVRMKYDEDFNYLQVLLARQSLLEARLALNSNRFLLLESTIEVYKALGGGN